MSSYIRHLEQLVACVAEARYDYEIAHGLEDELREETLLAIANGRVEGDEAKQAARLALSTGNIKFPRHCA